ncbi:MAG: hypothetical protein QM783_06850 [Phycisphaerales bacterium]
MDRVIERQRRLHGVEGLRLHRSGDARVQRALTQRVIVRRQVCRRQHVLVGADRRTARERAAVGKGRRSFADDCAAPEIGHAERGVAVAAVVRADLREQRTVLRGLQDPPVARDPVLTHQRRDRIRRVSEHTDVHADAEDALHRDKRRYHQRRLTIVDRLVVARGTRHLCRAALDRTTDGNESGENDRGSVGAHDLSECGRRTVQMGGPQHTP